MMAIIEMGITEATGKLSVSPEERCGNAMRR
jgi:hypothetical protein